MERSTLRFLLVAVFVVVVAGAGLLASGMLNNEGDARYVVSFDSAGGSSIPDQTVSKGDYASKPETSREGYTLDGWYTSASGGSYYDFDSAVEGDVKLYAHWTINKYAVEFYANGGTMANGLYMMKKTVSYGDKAYNPEIPTRTGYTFDGWYTSASGGTQFILSTPIYGNKTLYAHWSSSNCIVTFDMNGGSIGTNTTVTKSVAYGGTVSDPGIPARTGYAFDGWYTTASGGAQYSFNTAVYSDKTLYAHWSSDAYIVVFDANGGTFSSGNSTTSKTVYYGKTVSEPRIPTRTGYSFEGWYTSASGGWAYDLTSEVYSDKTLYAHWTTITYTVTFNANGGTFSSGASSSSKVVNPGSTVSSPETPTRSGYLFAGWYTAASDGNLYDFDSGVYSNKTLYALWSTSTCTVKFSANGGMYSAGGNIITATVVKGGAVNSPPEPTKTGYTFSGWYQPGSKTAYTFKNPVVNNITLYAQWTAIQYTVWVVADKYGSVDVDEYTVEYGTVLSTNENVLTVGSYGTTTATANRADSHYTYEFTGYTNGNTTVKGNWVVTANFEAYAVPYSVVIKYMCDGNPILKDGVDIRVNSQGEWGELFSYNYLDNPKFDEEMASKYTLVKGYLEKPSDPTDQKETVTTTISDTTTVIVFEFSKKGAYVQFHRQLNPVANPVYETSEPYGEKHTATIVASQEADAGKKIQVLITDYVSGNAAIGTFIGAGESATYHGYTYSVYQLDRIQRAGKIYDTVDIVISGGLNVHDDINDPLVIWYQLV